MNDENPTSSSSSAADRWSIDDAPDLTGRRAIVTGANSGLGLQESIALARRGVRVTLACRDEARGLAALDRVRDESGSRLVDLRLLDLADLSSVRSFAEGWDEPLDLLIANAGVMAVPFGRTADGFERQLGTNHLGHFALAGLLLPALRRSTAARVVTVSSLAHRMGRIDFDDLQGVQRYDRWRAYGQSKLANLLWAREFDRRVRASSDPILVAAAHPGGSATNLTQGLAGSNKRVASIVDRVSKAVFQSDVAGSLPILYAATMPDVLGGEYFGPDGFGEARGGPARAARSSRAYDDRIALRLWEVSEALTEVVYPDLPPATVFEPDRTGSTGADPGRMSPDGTGRL